jgi:hypothetical protein
LCWRRLHRCFRRSVGRSPWYSKKLPTCQQESGAMEGVKKGDVSQECENCKSVGSNMQPLMKCARCGLVEYCSRECQKQHWRTGGHKVHCVTEQERSLSFSCGSKLQVDDNAPACPFCREPFFSASLSMVTLRCRHVVHKSCLDGMLAFGVKRTCPLCRAELPNGDVISWEVSCANCSASKRPDNSPLQHCGRCKSVWYCGRECQKEHWKLGKHKELCDVFYSTAR